MTLYLHFRRQGLAIRILFFFTFTFIALMCSNFFLIEFLYLSFQILTHFAFPIGATSFAAISSMQNTEAGKKMSNAKDLIHSSSQSILNC